LGHTITPLQGQRYRASDYPMPLVVQRQSPALMLHLTSPRVCPTLCHLYSAR
jgi:hypothetical protein